MEHSGTGVVLTSDSFFYFAGEVFLWTVLAWGGAAMLQTHLQRRQRIVLGLALVFAFVSSLGPLFVRWGLSMPGLGGSDAGSEEFWFSFTATCPQAIAFGLLLWVAVSRPYYANGHKEQAV